MYGAILGLVYITILLLLKEIKKGDVKLVFPSYGKDDNQEVA
jgi:hypothetical protein